jgi:hypothetical protein
MPSLHRRVLGRGQDAIHLTNPASGLRPVEATAQDTEFRSVLTLHGGIAVSKEGLKVEAKLVRMRQAGLLDLERNVAPSFAATRVALSHQARQMMSGRGRVVSACNGPDAHENEADSAAIMLDQKQQLQSRCSGFEVARWMISAAVKSELATWHMADGPAMTAEFEAPMPTRMSQIQIPFPA